MADWTRFFVLFGGMIMMVGVAVALRWTFGTGHHQLHVPDPDDPTGDGLLEEVSRVPTEPAAQVLRARLGQAGIRATIGRAEGAYRLLVFPRDLPDAHVVLSGGGRE